MKTYEEVMQIVNENSKKEEILNVRDEIIKETNLNEVIEELRDKIKHKNTVNIVCIGAMLFTLFAYLLRVK